jgi:hypothetical protein
MSVGNQDHRRITVPVSVVVGCLHQALDLNRGQIFARAQLLIPLPAWLNCPIFGSWRHAPRALVENGTDVKRATAAAFRPESR